VVVYGDKVMRCLLLSCLFLILSTSASAIAAEAEMPIRVKILNLMEMPVREAIEMCADKSWVCQGPCDNAAPVDLVWACTFHMTCCSQANPYMGMSFEEELPATQDTGELESDFIDGFTVYE